MQQQPQCTNYGYADDRELHCNKERFEQYIEDRFGEKISFSQFAQEYAEYIPTISLKRISEFSPEFYVELSQIFDFGRANTREGMSKKLFNFLKTYPEFYHDNQAEVLQRFQRAVQEVNSMTHIKYPMVNLNPKYGGPIRQATKEKEPIPPTYEDLYQQHLQQQQQQMQ